MRMELMKGDILEISAHTPMNNPHILPLILDKAAYLIHIWTQIIHFTWYPPVSAIPANHWIFNSVARFRNTCLKTRLHGHIIIIGTDMPYRRTVKDPNMLHRRLT